MTNIFVYGSLMDPKIMFSICKGNYLSQSAVLNGYSLNQISNQIYPGLIKNENKSVSGVVYLGLNDSDVQALDLYEKEYCFPGKVEVEIKNKRTIPANVYFYNIP